MDSVYQHVFATQKADSLIRGVHAIGGGGVATVVFRGQRDESQGGGIILFQGGTSPGMKGNSSLWTEMRRWFSPPGKAWQEF